MADITIKEQDKKEKPSKKKNRGRLIITTNGKEDTPLTIWPRKGFPPVIVEAEGEEASKLYAAAKKEIDNLAEIMRADERATDLLQETQKLQQSVIEQLAGLHTEELQKATDIAFKQLEDQTAELQKAVDEFKNLFDNMPKNHFSAVTELFGQVTKAIESHPVFALYIEELEKLSKEEEYKDLDLTNVRIEYLDEEGTIEADTPKNRALHKAYVRAVERWEEQKKQEEEERALQPLLFEPAEEQSKKDKTEVDEAIAALSRALPPSHYFLNTGLFRDLQKAGAIKRSRQEAEAEPLRLLDIRKKEVESYVLAYYAGEQIKDAAGNVLIDHITTTQAGIMNAILSICYSFDQKDWYFTPAQLSRISKGGVEKDSHDDEKIKADLERLSNINIALDATDTYKARGLDIKAARKKGKLLDLREVEIETVNGKYSAFKILAPPILFEHAMETEQYFTIPMELTQITTTKRERIERKSQGKSVVKVHEAGKKIALTQGRIAIRNYLLQRIEILKKEKHKKEKKIIKDSPYKTVILTSSITDIALKEKKESAQDAGATLSRADKKRVIDFAMQCLDYWKTATDRRSGYCYLRGYSFREKRQGVEEAFIIEV